MKDHSKSKPVPAAVNPDVERLYAEGVARWSDLYKALAEWEQKEAAKAEAKLGARSASRRADDTESS
jgi:hypothetical protein